METEKRNGNLETNDRRVDACAQERDFSAVAPSFSEQVAAWMGVGHCTGAAMDDTLFVVQFAGWDLLDSLTAQDPSIVEDAMNSIAASLQLLYRCGARNLLSANMSNIGITPFVPEASKGFMTAQASVYSGYLVKVLAAYSGYMNISILDLFDISTDVATMPQLFGFTNVTEPCLSFAVVQDAFGKDRDEHLFRDTVHITREAHALIADIALRQPPDPD